MQLSPHAAPQLVQFLTLAATKQSDQGEGLITACPDFPILSFRFCNKRSLIADITHFAL
jgi:hypothetical protein